MNKFKKPDKELIFFNKQFILSDRTSNKINVFLCLNIIVFSEFSVRPSVVPTIAYVLIYLH